MYICTYVYLHICIYVYLQRCIYAYMYFLCISIYLCMYVYVYKGVYGYVYTYPQTLRLAFAKIVICYFRNLLFVQAKCVFFFLAPKKCNLIEPADTNEFEHVHFVWQGQDFAMVVKKYPVHFRWQARSILSILLCWKCEFSSFFLWFMSFLVFQ